MTDACDAVISEVGAKRREELENYETVTLRAAEVTSIAPEADGFFVACAMVRKTQMLLAIR
jgi:hypothetical protein